MSELTTAARPYARAAFEVASTNNVVEQWTGMLIFCAAIAHYPTMKAVLDNPRLSWQQAADLFHQVCAEQLDQRGKNFIKVLAEKNRLALLPEIATLFQRYRAQAQGTVDAELISAQEINEDQINAITNSLSRRLGKKVSLTTRIDKALIGGAIVRAGDIVIDGSLRGRLEKLSTALAN